VEESGGGPTFVGDPTAIDVGFGSTRSPCDDVLDDCAASDCEDDAGVEDEVELELEVTNVDADDTTALLAALDEAGGGCALVLSGGLAELDAAASTLGHSDLTPISSLKTPIMLASPKSTSLHTLLTTSPIFVSPATQASVHRAVPWGSKSLA
jgi:hypothetical protein